MASLRAARSRRPSVAAPICRRRGAPRPPAEMGAGTDGDGAGRHVTVTATPRPPAPGGGAMTHPGNEPPHGLAGERERNGPGSGRSPGSGRGPGARRTHPPRDHRRHLARALLAAALALLTTGLLLPQGLLLATGLVLAGMAVHRVRRPAGPRRTPSPPAPPPAAATRRPARHPADDQQRFSDAQRRRGGHTGREEADGEGPGRGRAHPRYRPVRGVPVRPVSGRTPNRRVAPKAVTRGTC